MVILIKFSLMRDMAMQKPAGFMSCICNLQNSNKLSVHSVFGLYQSRLISVMDLWLHIGKIIRGNHGQLEADWCGQYKEYWTMNSKRATFSF